MKVKLQYLIFYLLLLGPGFLKAQTDPEITVSGIVSEKDGNQPVPGVSVRLKDAKTGVMTDVNGRYSIKIPANGVLVFTYVGFVTAEVPVAGKSTLNVSMVQESKSLTDVVIVGYSQQSRAKTTAAVSKLDARQLVNTANASPVAALQGKLAGVSIPLSNGQPGSAPANIVIRGSSQVNAYNTGGTGNTGGSPTLANSQAGPLVIIDGVFRDLNDINSDDVESLQVMKDAASTAAYGARGANGVIVIKTKSGKFSNGKANITFNYRTNWETPSRDYDYLNAAEYLTLARTTIKNTSDFTAAQKNNFLNNGGFSAGTRVYTEKGQYGVNINTTALYDNIVAIEGQDYVDNLLSRGWATMDDPANPGTKLLYADNKYQDMIWNTGLTNNYNFGIDGGNEAANYNISMNYVDQEGTFVGTSYKRYSALGNFGFKATNNFQVNAMVNYQNLQPNYVDNYTNDLIRGVRITPLIRTFKDDGTPHTGENLTVRNRFHTLAYDNTSVRTERITSRLEGDWNIVKGLRFKPSISYLIDNDRTLFARKAFPDPLQFATQREKRETIEDGRQLMVDQIIQYNTTIKNSHNIMALAGFNYTRVDTNLVRIGSQRATNDYISTIDEPSISSVNGIPTTNVTAFGTSLIETRSASYFGQVNYDYKGKYLATAVLRYDGFSNFAPANKWALFPAASLGWNIHNEAFWSVEPVSSLKLRGSWGQAGSANLSLTSTYGRYDGSAYAQIPTVTRSNLANPNLKWETTETTDIAIDAGFLKDRLTLTVDWYNKLTKDRLDLKPLPSEAPFQNIVFNNGTLQNTGIEIEIGGNWIRKKDFSWSTNISFAYNHQEIKKLPYNGRDKNRQNGATVFDAASGKPIEVGGYAEGERPFSYYAFQVEGIFSTDADAAAWGKVDRMASAQGLGVGKKAGDYRWADLNNDDVIDANDMAFMGYKTPDKTGGMQNTLTYKNLTLRLNMDFAMGHVISNGALSRSLGQGRAYNEGAPREAVGDDIWQRPGDVGKQYARFSFGDFDNGQRNYLRNVNSIGGGSGNSSDVSTLIEKGNFIAFRELYLSYELPKKLMDKIKSTGMSLFASVTNIGYITRYKGLNPEIYNGYDPGGYPRPRQFTLGASLKF
jgi:TonB-linked SusC/RagA family outer membrane protein